MAAVLAVGEDAALSHASAAYSYGLRKSPAERVEILVPHARRVRPPNGVRVQRCRGLAERIDEQAMPARTTVEHTVLDLAAEGTADEAVALAALACQRGLTWDERLLRCWRRVGGTDGRRCCARRCAISVMARRAPSK